MEPVREQILNLQHISYTYHTLQGETLALSDISFSLKKGEPEYPGSPFFRHRIFRHSK